MPGNTTDLNTWLGLLEHGDRAPGLGNGPRLCSRGSCGRGRKWQARAWWRRL